MDRIPSDKLAFTISEGHRALGIGRTSLYALIKAGELERCRSREISRSARWDDWRLGRSRERKPQPGSIWRRCPSSLLERIRSAPRQPDHARRQCHLRFRTRSERCRDRRASKARAGRRCGPGILIPAEPRPRPHRRALALDRWRLRCASQRIAVRPTCPSSMFVDESPEDSESDLGRNSPSRLHRRAVAGQRPIDAGAII